VSGSNRSYAPTSPGPLRQTLQARWMRSSLQREENLSALDPKGRELKRAV
jgi:hypothetical protein